MQNIFNIEEEIPWLKMGELHKILGNLINGENWGGAINLGLFESQLNKLVKLPIDVKDKVVLVNQKILPSLLYKLTFQDEISDICVSINQKLSNAFMSILKLTGRKNYKLFTRLEIKKKVGWVCWIVKNIFLQIE